MDIWMISIIIPAYNIGAYLGKTLDSILAQSHENLEVIVVDDGSSDSTGAVAEDYARRDSRIRVIRQENGGVTSARLRGVREAGGQWIGFVDGDDLVEPWMYERLLKNALAHNAKISHCGYRMDFPNGRVDFYYNTGRLLCRDNAGGLNDLIRGDFVEPSLCTKLFRRELLESLLRSGGMPRDCRYNEDLLMNFRLFMAADKSVYEDVCPYHYVLRKGSAANSPMNRYKLYDPLEVARIILREAPEGARDSAEEKMVRILVNGAAMDLTPNPELIAPYREQSRRELRSRLWGILKGRSCGRKLIIQAIWAAVWPGSYRWVHKLHGRLTGNDKKYDF